MPRLRLSALLCDEFIRRVGVLYNTHRVGHLRMPLSPHGDYDSHGSVHDFNGYHHPMQSHTSVTSIPDSHALASTAFVIPVPVPVSTCQRHGVTLPGVNISLNLANSSRDRGAIKM